MHASRRQQVASTIKVSRLCRIFPQDYRWPSVFSPSTTPGKERLSEDHPGSPALFVNPRKESAVLILPCELEAFR
jgi:hypothetical protein